MERRTTLADVRNATRKRTAKREELLRQMGTAIPWGHACSARETALLRRTTGGGQACRHRAGKASLAALPKAIRSVRASLISGSLGSVVPAA